MTSQLTVTLIQTELVWENAKANREMFDALLNSPTKTDLVILPEMFSTGFSMASERLAESMAGDTLNWLKDKAQEFQVSICGSLIIKEDDHFYNRFVVAKADGTIEHYDKKHLFRMSQENQNYKAGENKLIFEVSGFKICPQVCYDLRFPVWTRNTEQYDLLLFVANWPKARREHWIRLLQARAIENQSYVIGLNRCGTDGNKIAYSGDSMIIDFNGRTLADLGDGSSYLTFTLNKADQEQYRFDFPAWKDADSYKFT